jgi:hypothetical protein
MCDADFIFVYLTNCMQCATLAALLVFIQNHNMQPMGNINNYSTLPTPVPGDNSSEKMVSYNTYHHSTIGATDCHWDVCNPRLVHWYIVRPTCYSLESKQRVGPLLTNAPGILNTFNPLLTK